MAMPPFLFKGRVYTLLLGSDVIRDGMYLELSEGKNVGIAEVFRSDESGETILATFGNDIPLEVIEWLVSQARERLLTR